MSGLLPNSRDYEFHPAVDDDIEIIVSHIIKDSIDGALRVLDRITGRIENLVPKEVRHQGHQRPDLTARPLLFVSAYDYLIAYDPDREPMLIVAVLHGRQEPRFLASLLKGRH